jgi:CheY-like chemotaxis protein
MGATGKTILVADDNAAFVEFVRLVLEEEGARVIAARDGEEAVRAAKEERPDAILLDLLMPRLDGLSALVRLKSDEATRHVPVILVSGMPGGEAERLARAYGAADFFAKPFKAADAAKRIVAAMERAKPSGARHAEVAP